MNPKLLLPVVAVACLGGLLWFLSRGDSQPPTQTLGQPSEAPVDVEPEPEVELQAAGPAQQGPGTRVASRTEAPTTAVASAAIDHPWADQLAGVTGRIVEADGEPVSGMAIELLQLDITSVLDTDGRLLGNEDIVIAEGVTDAEGRFTLQGATLGSFHVFGIDLGGPRSTIRVVERAMEYSAIVDVGDIELDEYGTLLGTVLDEDGEPVAGARVRAAPVPEIVVQSGVLDLRDDSRVAVAEGPMGKMVFEIPELVGRHLDRLPVPTTYTAEDGTFRLDGVPLSTICGGIDHPGYTATIIPTMTMKAGETDLGEFDLEYGRVLSGRVVDEAGDPVAGVEVAAGALHPMAPVGLLQPGGVTDAQGRFELRGLPELGQSIAFARRQSFNAWVPSEEGGADTSLEIRLGGVSNLRVHVTDAAGEPVSGALVRATRQDLAGQGGMGMMFMMSTNGFAGMESTERATASEVEPGVYSATGLSQGSWLVEAEVDGHAPGYATAEVGAAGADVSISCDPGRSIDVRVVDAGTREPVARARASLVGLRGATMGTLGAGWSDAEGKTRLGPFTQKANLPQSMLSGELEAPLLRVVHPEYGQYVEEVAAGQTMVEVALPPACSIEGRIHWGGRVPERPYTVFIERSGINGFQEAFATPGVTLSDSEGLFRFTSLAPGEYRLNVFERFFDVSPLDMMIEQREPTQRARQSVVVTIGDPAQVEVDLSPTGMGPTCRITGVVAAGGVPVVGATVSMNGSDDVDVETDSQGRFDSGEISAIQGGYYIEVRGEVTLEDGTRREEDLYSEWVSVEAGETKNIEVEAVIRTGYALVVDAATGFPIAGAEVQSWSNGNQSSVTTEADGRAEVVVQGKGNGGVRVSADGYASGSAVIDPDSEEPTRIELAMAVPCSGRVVAAPGTELPANGWLHVQVSQIEGSGSSGSSVDGPDRRFDFDDLAPGRYKAEFWGPGGQGEPFEFELGPAGSTNLELVYEVSGD